MSHTVRICKDLTGWFATIGDEAPEYPGVQVHWEQTFPVEEEAARVLDLAQSLTEGLRGERLLYWRPEPDPEAPPPPERRPDPLRVRAPAAHRASWLRHGRSALGDHRAPGSPRRRRGV